MLLFSVLFPVMEASTSQGEPDSRSNVTMMDESMVKITLSANLVLTEEELRSDLVDSSILQKNGTIVQFINTSCAGSSSVIGGIRINLQEIRKAPAYLSRNRRLIKQHAVRALTQHYQEMNFGLGAAEALTLDDYGMSFTVASVTHQGALMNPGKRQEGPMFFCHFPNLVDPIVLSHADWGVNVEGCAVHFINAYINILPQHQRRNFLIAKDKEDKAAAKAARESPSSSGPAKKSKASPPSTSPSTSKGASKQQNPESAALREEIARLKVLTARLQQQLLPSPPLPATRPIVWPNPNQGPDLPDDM